MRRQRRYPFNYEAAAPQYGEYGDGALESQMPPGLAYNPNFLPHPAHYPTNSNFSHGMGGGYPYYTAMGGDGPNYENQYMQCGTSLMSQDAKAIFAGYGMGNFAEVSPQGNRSMYAQSGPPSQMPHNFIRGSSENVRNHQHGQMTSNSHHGHSHSDEELDGISKSIYTTQQSSSPADSVPPGLAQYVKSTDIDRGETSHSDKNGVVSSLKSMSQSSKDDMVSSSSDDEGKFKSRAEKTEIEVDGHDKENNQEETSGTEKGEPAVNDDADESSMGDDASTQQDDGTDHFDAVNLEESTTSGLCKNLLIGVMTSPALLSTRALAIAESWGRHAANIQFYVGNSTDEETLLSEEINPGQLSVVRLEDADDGYPPQIKEFMMFESMFKSANTKHIDWFMKADDDTFVRVGKLCKWLHQFDKERFGKPPGPLGALYIGRPGWGRKEETSSLELGFMGEKRSYCLGGPGYVLSIDALRAVAPKLRSCLSDVQSNHSDSEMGRCIVRNVGIECLATDVEDLNLAFVQTYKGKSGKKEQASEFEKKVTISQVRSALTLHPLKKPAEMQSIYLQLKSIDYADDSL